MGKTNTEVAVFDNEFLKGVSGLGMRGVDPMDIRPPQILLAQASSNLEDFKTPSGQNPKIGQYFHTGRNEIMDTFECYIIFAAKGKYIDKNKQPPEERDQYRTIGCMADDLTPFMMNFRSSALYALSSLFTAVASQCKPMFSIKIKIETKELQNDNGKKWRVPVIRVLGVEKDQVKLDELYNKALVYDMNASKVEAEDDDVIEIPDVTVEGNKDEMPF